jgi:hypothetical protein
MCWGDIRGAYADEVAGVADDECFLEGVTLDSTAVLEGLRVSKCNDACDAIFDVLRQTFHGAMGDSCSLAVPCGHNLGLRAVDSRIGEEDLHLVDSVWWRAARVEIGLNQCQIIDSLTSHIFGAKICLEAVGEGRSYRNALHRVSLGFKSAGSICLTIFPGAEVCRAQMKMTGLHPV